MKNILKTLGLALLAGLAFASCSPDKFEGADQNGLPSIADANYTVSVNQKTNIVTFTLNTPGCYPIWTIEGKPEYKGTINGLQRYYDSRGTYHFTLKVGNRNGISDGQIEGTFTVDSTRHDFSGIIDKLTGGSSKEWRIFAAKRGHLSCGPAGTDGNEWWSAAPNEKADQGIYDDRLTFSADNSYAYSAGEDGNTFVNAGVKSLGVDAPGDYSLPLVGQFGMEAAAKYSLGYDDGIKTETITLPARTLFPYIAHQAQIDEDYTLRILALDSKYMELALDLPDIVWHFSLINGDDPVPSSDFDPDKVNWADATSDLNLAKGLNSVGKMVFWWADAGWAQQADPTFAFANGVYDITAPYATAAQWQAQCSIHNGDVNLKAGQAYDISVTLVANEPFENATIKICQEDNDDNTLLYSSPVSLKRGDNVLRFAKRYVKHEKVGDVDASNAKLVIDLGGCPAGLNVKVKDIIIQAHNPK